MTVRRTIARVLSPLEGATNTEYVVIYGSPYDASNDFVQISRGAAELEREIRKFGRDLAWTRALKRQANKNATLDVRSRERRPPPRGSPPAHRRLQTYNDAMAARMAARRIG